VVKLFIQRANDSNKIKNKNTDFTFRGDKEKKRYFYAKIVLEIVL